MEKKNQVLMTVLGVFALVIVTVGVSYAFFNYTRTGNTENTITTGTTPITFGFTNEGTSIELTDATPLTDTQGASLTPYTFTVAGTMPTNSTVNYKIYAVNDTANYLAKEGNENLEALDASSVKIALYESGSTTALSGPKLVSELTDGLIYETTVNTGTANTLIDKDYELRMWLASSTAGGNINADDQGTGTIPGGDNYTTEDGQTITSTTANKAFSLKVKVVASAVSSIQE